jgi:hypothetical protein
VDFRLKNPEETFFADVISGLRAPNNRSCFVTEGAVPGWHTVVAELSSVCRLSSSDSFRNAGWSRKGDLNLERCGIYILVEGTHGGWGQSTIRFRQNYV